MLTHVVGSCLFHTFTQAVFLTKKSVNEVVYMISFEKKLQDDELKAGDCIMADKGFTITKELEEIGLRLNIPPFLGKRKQLASSDVKDTQLIAHHRIHVERAIGKVKGFHIFDRKFRIKATGVLNQIWTDCCLLANFQDPLIVQVSSEDD